MKNRRCKKGQGDVFRVFRSLFDVNPFFMDLILWLLAAAAAACVIALLYRSRFLGNSLTTGVSMSFAGPAAIGLTAAILNFFGYREYKREHPGLRIDRKAYIRLKKKQQSDFEQRYASQQELHRYR